MEDEPEVIRQRMEESRTSLSEKLDELENKVVGVMGGATEAVSETVESVQASVESVKGAVEDTVQSIRSAFDIRAHFERNPWMSLGGAVLAGFIGGRLIGPGARAVRSYLPSVAPPATGAPPPTYQPPMPASTPVSAPSAKGPSWSFLDGPLGEAADSLKGLAIGSVLGLLRDLAAEHLPESIGKSVSETVDNMTTKLGGKKLPANTFGDFLEDLNKGHEDHSEEPKHEATAFGAPLTTEDNDDRAGGKNRKSVKAGRR